MRYTPVQYGITCGGLMLRNYIRSAILNSYVYMERPILTVYLSIFCVCVYSYKLNMFQRSLHYRYVTEE